MYRLKEIVNVDVVVCGDGVGVVKEVEHVLHTIAHEGVVAVCELFPLTGFIATKAFAVDGVNWLFPSKAMLFKHGFVVPDPAEVFGSRDVRQGHMVFTKDSRPMQFGRHNIYVIVGQEDITKRYMLDIGPCIADRDCHGHRFTVLVRNRVPPRPANR